MSKKQTTLFESWTQKKDNVTKRMPSMSNNILEKPSTSKCSAPSSVITLDDDDEDDDNDDEMLVRAMEMSLMTHENSNSTEIPVGTPLEALPGFDVAAGTTWIYPINYPVRDYQFNIAKEALFKNTMVILPTGLGKTFIAAVIMYNFYRWYPEGKIVFMAPTRPLVAQQIEACHKIMGIPLSDSIELTGSVSPENRRLAWNKKRVFFLTPQVMTNDLSRCYCPVQSVKCLVVDEAHKALGNYAYCQVVKEVANYHTQFRVLALSATPGSDINAVMKVLNNLLISHVELRTEDSPDIKPYTHERTVEKIVVPLDDELKDIQSKFSDIIKFYLNRLCQKRVISSMNPQHFTKYKILKIKEDVSQNPPIHLNRQEFVSAQCDLCLCISLYHALELLQPHGMRPFYSFLKGMLDGSKGNPRSRSELLRNPVMAEVISQLEEKFTPAESAANTSVLGQGGRTPFVSGHPKMKKLEEVVLQHFDKCQLEAGRENPVNTRVMIFSQYRDSVQEITEMLQRHHPRIRVMSFIGQSSSTNKGFSKQQQIQVIQEFRQGGYNTLVSTCVGEEGLDIGEIDFIICYDAPKSPIRLVQRMGRTGRRRDGRIVVLVTQGKEEQSYNQSVSSKQRIHNQITQQAGFQKLYPNNPRMVPQGLNPRCLKMHMTVEKYTAPGKKGRNNKLQTITSALAKVSSKAKSVLSSEELAYWDTHFKVAEDEVPILEWTLPNKQHSQRDVNKRPRLSLTEWMPWQNTLQSTRRFSHSARTIDFVEILQFIELQNMLDPNDDPYSLEMAAFLRTEDVIEPSDNDAAATHQKQLRNPEDNISDDGNECLNQEDSETDKNGVNKSNKGGKTKKSRKENKKIVRAKLGDVSKKKTETSSKGKSKTKSVHKSLLPEKKLPQVMDFSSDEDNFEFQNKKVISEKTVHTVADNPLPDLTANNTLVDDFEMARECSPALSLSNKESQFRLNRKLCQMLDIAIPEQDVQFYQKQNGLRPPPSDSELFPLDKEQLSPVDLKEIIGKECNIKINDATSANWDLDEGVSCVHDEFIMECKNAPIEERVACNITENHCLLDTEKDENLRNHLSACKELSKSSPLQKNNSTDPILKHPESSSEKVNWDLDGFLSDCSAEEFVENEDLAFSIKIDTEKLNFTKNGTQVLEKLQNEELKENVNETALNIRNDQPLDDENCRFSLSPVLPYNCKNSPSTACSSLFLTNPLIFDQVAAASTPKCSNKLSRTKRQQTSKTSSPVCLEKQSSDRSKLLNDSFEEVFKDIETPSFKKPSDHSKTAKSVFETSSKYTVTQLVEMVNQPSLNQLFSPTCKTPEPKNMQPNLHTNDDKESTKIDCNVSNQKLNANAANKISFDLGFDLSQWSDDESQDAIPPSPPSVWTSQSLKSINGAKRALNLDAISKEPINEAVNGSAQPMDGSSNIGTKQNGNFLSKSTRPFGRNGMSSNSRSLIVTTPVALVKPFNKNEDAMSNDGFDNNESNVKEEVQIIGISDPQSRHYKRPMEDEDDDFRFTRKKQRKDTLQENNAGIQIEDLPLAKKKTHKKKKANMELGEEYLLKEADVSIVGDKCMSSDEDSELVNFSSLDSSFIDDGEADSTPDVSKDDAGPVEDMQAIYLRSVMDAANCPNGKFKLKFDYDRDMPVCSQIVQTEVDYYELDSFCVANDDEDSPIRPKNKPTKRRKYKRIVKNAESSSDEDRDALCVQSSPVVPRKYDDSFGKADNPIDCDQDSPLCHFEVPAPTKSKRNFITPLSSASKTVLETKSDSAFKTPELIDTESRNSTMRRAQTCRSSRSISPVSSSFVNCTVSSLPSDEFQRQERLRRQKEKRAEFLRKQNERAFLQATSNLQSTSSSSYVPERKKPGLGETINNMLHDHQTVQGSFNDEQSDTSICEAQDSASSVAADMQYKPLQSPYAKKQVIFVDTKEINGAQAIVSCMRLKYNAEAVVRSLTAADYIVSNRMGVHRRLLRDAANPQNRQKLVDRIRHLCELFDRPCVIFESEKIKNGEQLRTLHRSKYLDTVLSYFTQTYIKILYSDSQEASAKILCDLAHQEEKKNQAVQVPMIVISKQIPTLPFYLSLPQVSTVCALNLAYGYDSIHSFIHSSPKRIEEIGKMSSTRAKAIYDYLRHQYNV